MPNTSSYLRSDAHLKEAHEKLDFLTSHGFNSTLYESSVLYSRTKDGIVEEISVRIMRYATLRVEHSKIKRTKISQRVKTDSMTGNLGECIAYVEGRFKTH